MATLTGLPVELVWEIAMRLNDSDVAHLIGTCKRLADCIEASNSFFWRRRFLCQYTLPLCKGHPLLNEHLRTIYARRSRLIIRAPRFAAASHHWLTRCMNEMFLLIRDTFPETGDWRKNMVAVMRFCAHSDFFMATVIRFRTRTDASAQEFCLKYRMLKTLLFPFSINNSIVPVAQMQLGAFFAEAQAYIYRTNTPGTMFAAPESLGQTIPALLHAMTLFWRWHLTRPNADTLAFAYSALESRFKIHCWDRPLRPSVCAVPVGQELLVTWSGLNSNVLATIIQPFYIPGQMVVEDSFPGGGDFVRLYMRYKKGEEVGDADWPARNEARMRAHLYADNTARRRCLFFEACARPEEHKAHMRGCGWISPIPVWLGIPNWQRIVMIAVLVDELGEVVNYTRNGMVFEGVVLPGGRVVMGRWGIGVQATFGPFIMWNVDESMRRIGDEEMAEICHGACYSIE